MYRSKSDGRNTYRFFEFAMDARIQQRRLLDLDIRRAVENEEFELYYQPQVDARTENITGCEALLRWNHPSRGMVAPNEFIPVAEESGMIVPIGAWAIQQACRDAATWPSDIAVAVNLSPVQFTGPPLVQTVISALDASGLSPLRLELEITESTLLAEQRRHHRHAQAIARPGRADRHGRFRHRLLVVELPAIFPFRQDQDRSQLHQGPRRKKRLRGDRQGHGRSRRGARHDHHGRRRRDGRAVGARSAISVASKRKAFCSGDLRPPRQCWPCSVSGSRRCGVRPTISRAARPIAAPRLRPDRSRSAPARRSSERTASLRALAILRLGALRRRRLHARNALQIGRDRGIKKQLSLCLGSIMSIPTDWPPFCDIVFIQGGGGLPCVKLRDLAYEGRVRDWL